MGAAGPLNAAIVLAMQAFDMVFLFFMRPFNDAQVTITEAFSGLSNMAAYICLGLPVIYGPSFSLGEIPTMLFMSIGVVVSALASALQVLPSSYFFPGTPHKPDILPLVAYLMAADSE